MRSTMLTAGLLLALAVPAWAADGIVAFQATARVEVDATGKPVRIEAPADLPEPIRAFIEKRVASWHYTPAVVDGVPQTGTTYVRVGACAVPEGGQFRLAIDYKGNGPRFAGDKLVPPAYPQRALQHRVGGTFEVIVAIAEDGTASPESIKPLQEDRRWNDVFKDTLAQWVGRMRYDTEQVGGRSVATRIRIPVSFTPGSTRNRSALREELEHKASTQDECRLATGAAGGLQPVALDSPIKVTPAG
jgi:hypothetical protein